MKRLYVLGIITVACILLASCQADDTVDSYIDVEATEKMLEKEKEEAQYPNVGDADIFDFAYIKGAPEADGNYDVDDIIKMYASTGSFDDPQPPIAIDIENNEIYVEPDIGRYGVDLEKKRKQVDDTDKVLELFERYDVLDWQNYYSDVKDYHSYEDGSSWSLVVQYEDGTIEEFRGEGTTNITPDNYSDFMNELKDYVAEHLDDQNGLCLE